ncbi:hypothetical protein GCM10027168_28230 [Streptomyces capparidis]
MSGISRFTRGRRRPPLGERVGHDDADRSWTTSDDDPSGARVSPRPQIAPRFALAIVSVIIVASPIAAVFNLLDRRPSQHVMLASLATLFTLTVLQFGHLAWHRTLKRTRRGPTALLVQALLVYTPFLWARNGWVGAPYFLAASTLLVLPRRFAWTVFAAVCLTVPAVHRSVGASWFDTAYYAVSTPALGLAVFGLTRLADLVKELYDTRAELARLAVTQERLRFARDLHDLLGYSLSAITLKSELVYRLADRHTARAKQELESVLVLSRQALADVRAVSSAYREMSLGAECTSARSILSAADIDVRIDVDTDEMSGAVNTVLATVLREGVTNLLRHSKAQRCEIKALVLDGAARLTVVNDGVRPPLGDSPGRKGTGIENLAQRVEVLGGGLEAGVGTDGRFHLEAWVPLDPRSGEHGEDEDGAGRDGRPGPREAGRGRDGGAAGAKGPRPDQGAAAGPGGERDGQGGAPRGCGADGTAA